MHHSAATPTQTSPRLSGIDLRNHNETLITAQRHCQRGLQQNHNETLITARPAHQARSGLNHNETLIAARPARGSA